MRLCVRGFSCVSSVTMRPIACKASLCEGTTIVELRGVCFVGWVGCCNLELCCCCCWFVCFVLVSIYLFHTFFLFSINNFFWGFLLSFFLSFCLFITKMSSACTYTIYIYTCIGTCVLLFVHTRSVACTIAQTFDISKLMKPTDNQLN